MDREEFIALKVKELGDRTYVIVAEKHDGTRILIPDPGTERPWSSRNKKLAESHAAEFARMPEFAKAGAVTVHEAFNVLHNQFLKTNRRR